MLYLIWAIINLLLVALFLGTCWNATKLVKERYGVLLAIVFVFGLLSFIGKSNNSASGQHNGKSEIRRWKFGEIERPGKNASSATEVLVDKNILNQTHLFIGYMKGENDLNTPVDGYVSTTGFIGGTTWKPLSVLVNKTENNNQFRYQVRAVEEWNLLWLTVYSDIKEVQGTVSVR